MDNSAEPSLLSLQYRLTRLVSRLRARMAGAFDEEVRPEGDGRRELITKEEMRAHLEGLPYMISHGGVSSENLASKLGLNYSTAPVGPKPRSFEGAFVHAPFPPDEGASVGIYLYGQLFQSIISQLRRHPDNPRKLKNDESYPEVTSLEELFELGGADPFGVLGQFTAFCRADVTYPLIFLNRDRLGAVYPLLRQYLKVDDTTEWEERARESDFHGEPFDAKRKLEGIYGSLDAVMRSMPGIMVKYPQSAVQLDDGLSQSSVLEMSSLECLLECSVESIKLLEPQLDIAVFKPRIKHALRLQDGRFCTNLRLDVLKPSGGILSCISKVVMFKTDGHQIDAASVSQVTHPDCLSESSERSSFVGFEDTRLISLDSDDYLVVNGFTLDNQRAMFLYDVSAEACVRLSIDGLSTNPTEKNWSPFVYEGVLHFLYSINPLVIARMDDFGKDAKVVAKRTKESKIRSDYPWGSTPLVPWVPPYYVGFAHSREPWRAIPYLVDLESMSTIIGNPIKFTAPEGAVAWRGKSVQFPYDLSIADGVVRLSVEFEDRFPAELKLDFDDFCKELSRLMARA